MRITIVGPGRLGRSLAVIWGRTGHAVTVVGRGQPVPDGDATVLTVPDAAIREVAAQLQVAGVLLHCSGALDLDVLRPHRPAGSLHPLMTFPGPEVDLPDLQGVVAAVAGDPIALTTARRLATDAGLRPVEIPGDRRLYHAAAVMAGNLGTVLVALAARVLAGAGVDEAEARAILAPLAVRSVRNAPLGLARSLTGPIPRGDIATLEAHRAALIAHGLDDIDAIYGQLIEAATLELRRGESEEGGRC